MPLISYTVKREFAVGSTAFVSVTDIEANASAQAFYSSTTDLSGLNEDDWLVTLGFTNSANNGYFQVLATSSATGVRVSAYQTSVVDENASTAVPVTAYELAYGGPDDIDSFTFIASRYDFPFEVTRREHVAIGGRVETVHHRDTKYYQLDTDLFTSSDLPRWEQFWFSVARGEEFTFDFYGSIIAATGSVILSEPITVRLEDKRMSLRRVDTSDYFTMSLRLREV